MIWLFLCEAGHWTAADGPRSVCQHAGCALKLHRVREDGTRYPTRKAVPA